MSDFGAVLVDLTHAILGPTHSNFVYFPYAHMFQLPSIRLHFVAVYGRRGGRHLDTCRAVALAIFFSATAVLVGPIAQAQAVCPTTVSTIDRTLCAQPELRILLDSLGRTLKRIQSSCGLEATQAAAKTISHREWLSTVSAGLDHLNGVAPRHYVGSIFTQRADELAEAELLCAERIGGQAVQIRIAASRFPKNPGQDEANSWILVETQPPLVGQRINNALFEEVLGIEPPVSLKLEDVRKALARTPASPTIVRVTNETVQMSVLSRSPRVLVLQVSNSGCETRCWNNIEQRVFDLRTGARVEPVDVFGTQERRSFNRLAESLVVQAARDLRRRNAAQWAGEGLESFDRCLSEWRGWHPIDGNQIIWLPNQRWQVVGPACSGDGDAAPPALASKTFPIASLAPYLSLYGKSLLLGTGEVFKPVPPESACTAQSAPTDPSGWGARVKEISVGEDHTFLREESGRVWGWGRNYNGAVGNGEPGDGGGEWVAPFVMGDDYLYAGAGQGFSVSLRKDGSLWTWGSGYGGRLGDGTKNRPQPALIGRQFTQADVGNYGGRALGNDGRLWAWGGSQRPRLEAVAQNVKQVQGDSPVLVLQRDGSLLALNEWNWSSEAEVISSPEAVHWHGIGFERLPRTRNLQLAWRADGSAWAWGRTLSTMTTPSKLLGQRETPWPRLVGRGWIDVQASQDSTLVAARKADGSLWVSQERGGKASMQRVGCGFADMAFASDENKDIHLLALRSDGVLLDYQSSQRDGGNPRRDLLERTPQVLAKQGVRLFLENDYWGNVGGTVLLLKQDGTLWQWYWRFGRQYPKEGVPLGQRLFKINFPDIWFQGRPLRE